MLGIWAKAGTIISSAGGFSSGGSASLVLATVLVVVLFSGAVSESSILSYGERWMAWCL